MSRRVTPTEEAYLRLAIAARESGLAAELLRADSRETQQDLIHRRADIERLRAELKGAP